MQIILYGICVLFCVLYCIDGVRELLSPDRSTGLIEAMGETGYYAMTVVRILVLLATGIAFARLMVRMYRDKD